MFDGVVDTEKMGRRREKIDEIYYRTNPDAELVTRDSKGKISGCKAHLCVDREERVILSIDGSKASEDDMSKIGTLYTGAISITGKELRMVIGDKHYGGVWKSHLVVALRIKLCD